ncbi:MAG: cupin domain-containing protein [Betaproteobacteria bacterium]|nr:cupin domain-containing protein [Betaproteobacteria bacterium]
MNKDLLGQLSTAQFLRRHWQKKPLLVRNAIPGFDGIVGESELFRLACSDSVESRLVAQRRGRWHLRHGPFDARTLAELPARNCTLLVQGLNLLYPQADALMRRFSFIPYARMDDVMVSYARPGGGVGAHLDSYDVFLLQGPGRRRWRIGRIQSPQFDPRAPLKILQRFRHEQEWILESGDMLYLPPGYAHEGTALDTCFTYSIGFRAPAHQELASQVLTRLQERIALDGLYSDRGLRPPRNPAAIPAAMVAQTTHTIGRLRWRSADIVASLGEYLSEPKQQVFFVPPQRPMGVRAFSAALDKRGARLDLKTAMLFYGPDFFVNGERYAIALPERRALRTLANERRLPAATQITGPLRHLLYDWYRAGWLVFETRGLPGGTRGT